MAAVGCLRRRRSDPTVASIAVVDNRDADISPPPPPPRPQRFLHLASRITRERLRHAESPSEEWGREGREGQREYQGELYREKGELKARGRQLSEGGSLELRREREREVEFTLRRLKKGREEGREERRGGRYPEDLLVWDKRVSFRVRCPVLA